MFRRGSCTIGIVVGGVTAVRSLTLMICAPSSDVAARLSNGRLPDVCGVLVVLAGVGVLLPNPMNVHHRNRIAMTPRTAAQISFFFSPGLFRSASSIIAPDCH